VQCTCCRDDVLAYAHCGGEFRIAWVVEGHRPGQQRQQDFFFDVIRIGQGVKVELFAQMQRIAGGGQLLLRRGAQPETDALCLIAGFQMLGDAEFDRPAARKRSFVAAMSARLSRESESPPLSLPHFSSLFHSIPFYYGDRSVYLSCYKKRSSNFRL